MQAALHLTEIKLLKVIVYFLIAQYIRNDFQTPRGSRRGDFPISFCSRSPIEAEASSPVYLVLIGAGLFSPRSQFHEYYYI